MQRQKYYRFRVTSVANIQLLKSKLYCGGVLFRPAKPVPEQAVGII